MEATTLTEDPSRSHHGHRSRHSRRSRRGRKRSRSALPRELRTWLKLVDAVLVGVEKTAWSLRGIADEVHDAFGATGEDLRSFSDDLGGQHKGLVRLTRTGFALAQIAGSYRLYSLRAAFLSRAKAADLLAEIHENNARRFYNTCVEHGGAFVKVGQVLSARGDIMPKPWVDELASLQDAVPPLPWPVIQEVLEAELGAPVAELFASFDEAPLAAASIGQVHRAITHDGVAVAVKVQRPGIDEAVRIDLKSLEIFMQTMRGSLPELDYDTIVTEVKSAVLAELDYAEEATITAQVAKAFGRSQQVVIPQPVTALCSERVLTTTFVEGEKLTRTLDVLKARAEAGDAGAQAELSRLLGTLLQAYLRQILIFGVFQADPHPGNLLATRDGKLCILDFGCSKTLSPEVKRGYLALMRALMQDDKPAMNTLFTELGFATRTGKPDTLHAFADALLVEFRSALEKGRFDWPDKQALLDRASGLLEASEDDPVVTIPTEFVMIARVLATLGGLFSYYRPDISFAEHVLPVLGSALFDLNQA
jgi:ubiquinone biosynthesis protein